jgi:hypothetical protein
MLSTINTLKQKVNYMWSTENEYIDDGNDDDDNDVGDVRLLLARTPTK